jgi:tetratricopeptide (TPR) repeat protein
MRFGACSRSDFHTIGAGAGKPLFALHCSTAGAASRPDRLLCRFRFDGLWTAQEAAVTETTRRYRAFISYSHRDKAVAAWVQSALEHYHMPSKLVGTTTAVGEVPARLHPLFRDRDELPASGDLGSELMAALQSSLFLILICSPASAKSRWVNEEVLNFKRMHGEGRVLALIAGGEPGSGGDTECFPRALQYKIGADGELSDVLAEPIAADIRPQGDGKRLAKFKLIAGLTGVRLDDLIQREAARRARRLTIIAVAATVGMVGALGLAFYANSQRLVAIEQRTIAERESAASRAAADFLVDTFKIADPTTENPRTVTALTILGRSAERARKELKAQPAIQVRLIDTVARAYGNLGLFDEARGAIDDSRPLFDTLGAAAVMPLLTLADVEFRDGDLDRAIVMIDEAEARLRSDSTGSPARDREMRARANEIRAFVHYARNELGEALAGYDAALALYRSSVTSRPAAIARVLNNRGLLLSTMGRRDEATASMLESNRAYRALYGDNHINVGQSFYTIATNQLAAGDPAAALASIDKALQVLGHVIEPSNPIFAAAQSKRGQILSALNRPAEAAAVLAKATANYRAAFGKPHYLIGITEVYQALALSESGKGERALLLLDDARRNYDISYGKQHANHGDLLVNRAVVLAKLGRRDEAQADCRAGIAILDATMDKADSLYGQSVAQCAAIGQTS